MAGQEHSSLVLMIPMLSAPYGLLVAPLHALRLPACLSCARAWLPPGGPLSYRSLRAQRHCSASRPAHYAVKHMAWRSTGPCRGACCKRCARHAEHAGLGAQSYNEDVEDVALVAAPAEGEELYAPPAAGRGAGRGRGRRGGGRGRGRGRGRGWGGRGRSSANAADRRLSDPVRWPSQMKSVYAEPDTDEDEAEWEAEEDDESPRGALLHTQWRQAALSS